MTRTNNNIIISVEHLSKQYDLGVVGSGTLTRDVERWWARVRKQPDPYTIIGREDAFKHIGESILALDDVSFTVQQGEALGIIGRNGAGKSTLLKILSRVTAPTSGVVKVKGRIGSLLEVGTGFHGELTGRENVFLNGTIIGMKRDEVAKKFDEIVDFSGIEAFIDTPVKRYSSGMFVRLAFSVAAHLDADILIMDEVLAVGDTEFQKKCLAKMSKAAIDGRTVLFVSHNMAAVRNLCQNAFWIENGSIIETGRTENVIASYLSKPNQEMSLTPLSEFTKSGGATQIQLQKFLMLNSLGSITTSFERNDLFSIRVEYEIFQEVPELRVAFQILTPDNVVVLTAPDTDSSNLGPIKREAGRFVSECNFPGGVLNSGLYTVRLIFDIPGASKPIYLLDNAISFRIVQTENFSGTYYNHPGVIFIRLPWKVTKIENDNNFQEKS